MRVALLAGSALTVLTASVTAAGDPQGVTVVDTHCVAQTARATWSALPPVSNTKPCAFGYLPEQASCTRVTESVYVSESLARLSVAPAPAQCVKVRTPAPAQLLMFQELLLTVERWCRVVARDSRECVPGMAP